MYQSVLDSYEELRGHSRSFLEMSFLTHFSISREAGHAGGIGGHGWDHHRRGQEAEGEVPWVQGEGLRGAWAPPRPALPGDGGLNAGMFPTCGLSCSQRLSQQSAWPWVPRAASALELKVLAPDTSAPTALHLVGCVYLSLPGDKGQQCMTQVPRWTGVGESSWGASQDRPRAVSAQAQVLGSEIWEGHLGLGRGSETPHWWYPRILSCCLFL